MKIDLTEIAGFPCFFNPKTLDIRANDKYGISTKDRYASDLKKVWKFPDKSGDNQIAYRTAVLDKMPNEIQSVMDKFDLIYSFVIMPALQIGGEFVKTAGHYHETMPGQPFGYPEVYMQIYGTQYLLLQKPNPENAGSIIDAAIIEMTPGSIVEIPPDYAHVIINSSAESTLLAGLYNHSFRPLYDSIRTQRGLAYYILSEEDEIRIDQNPSYQNPSVLRHISNVKGTLYDPPQKGLPLWTSFLRNPEIYAFLTDPDAASQRYNQTYLKKKYE